MSLSIYHIDRSDYHFRSTSTASLWEALPPDLQRLLNYVHVPLEIQLVDAPQRAAHDLSEKTAAFDRLQEQLTAAIEDKSSLEQRNRYLETTVSRNRSLIKSLEDRLNGAKDAKGKQDALVAEKDTAIGTLERAKEEAVNAKNTKAKELESVRKTTNADQVKHAALVLEKDKTIKALRSAAAQDCTEIDNANKAVDSSNHRQLLSLLGQRQP
ncbi:MAG: hypothetical protein Q9208_002442 [Pyrenodesmia sp. 3 TL-2023]